MKKQLKFALGLLVSLAALYWAFKGVEFAKVWAELKKASVGWFALLVVATVYSQLVRAQRWDHLFRHLKRIELGSLFSSTMVGIAANNVLPFRIGEAVRGYSIARKEGLPFTTCFTTVVLERIFDMLTVLGLLAVMLMVVEVPEAAGPQVTQAAQAIGVLAVAVVGGIVFLFFKQELMLRWVDKLLALMPEKAAEPLRHMVHAFIKGLEALTDTKQLLYLFGYSVWLWVTFAAAFAFAVKSFHLDANFGVPVVQAGFVTVLFVAIFVMVPAAPGFVGTFQAGCIVALSIFGVPKDAALGYSLLAHAGQFIPITFLGMIYFFREGISLSEVEKAGEPSPEAVEHEMEVLEKKQEEERDEEGDLKRAGS